MSCTVDILWIYYPAVDIRGYTVDILDISGYTMDINWYNIDIKWNYSVTDIEVNNWNSHDSREYYGFSLNINDIDMLIDDILNIF